MSRPAFSLKATTVTLTRGDRTILRDVSVAVGPRTRLAIVGPNGVGKSTLLQVLTGDVEPDAGTVVAQPDTLRIGLLDQELPRGDQTVREHLGERTGVARATERFEAAAAAIADGGAAVEREYEAALEDWMAIGAADFDARLHSTFDELGLADRLADQSTASLSGGEAARVGLAALLLSRFDVTLLDEPTNNLDAAGLAVLDRWVDDHQGGLVIVSHDRRFLKRVVTSVLELHEHHHTAELFHGGWQAYRDERAAGLARARAEYGRYVDERDRLRASAQRQREWVDRGVSAAKKRPADGDKFRRNWRIDQTEKLAGKARATDQALERLEVVEKPWEGWQLQFSVASAPRSGAVVAVMEELVLRQGDFVLGPIDEEIRWGERVHLAGANGTGKSTLVAGILGRLEPASGRARLGSSVVVGVLGQERDEFSEDDRPLLESFPDRSGLDHTESRSVLAKFGLDADAVQRPCSTLSPGERTRALLALFQARGVNFLILDEPSNHLDLPAIEQLESALEDYDGTLLLVTHDQTLLDNIDVTRTIQL